MRSRGLPPKLAALLKLTLSSNLAVSGDPDFTYQGHHIVHSLKFIALLVELIE